MNKLIEDLALWVVIIIVAFVVISVIALKLAGPLGGPIIIKTFFFPVKILGTILIKVIGLGTRQAILASRGYVKDEKNQTVVENISAILMILYCIWFSIKSPMYIASAFNHQFSWGPVIFAVIALFTYKWSRVILAAPIIKAISGLSEWAKEFVVLSLTRLTLGLAGANMFMAFLYKSYPGFAVVGATVSFLGAIVSACYNLLRENVTTAEQILNIEIKTRNKEDTLDPTNEDTTTPVTKKEADLIIAQSKADKNRASTPIVIPSISRKQHMQILGPTGVGKTIALTNIAVQDLSNRSIGFIAMEPKGDLVADLENVCKRIKRKAYIIDPDNPNSEKINPLDGDDFDVVAEDNAQAFMGYLGKNANEFYKNKQKNALKMAIKVCKTIKGDDAIYDDLLDTLRPTNNKHRETLVKQVEDKRLRDDLEEYITEFSDPKMFNQAIQNYNGLYDYLKELTSNRYLRNIICAKSTVSFKDVFNNGEVVLVSTAKGTLKSLGNTFGRFIVNMIQSETFARNAVKDRAARKQLPDISCIIDEVQSYVSEPFGEIFEMARSNGMMMTIAHQDLSQLRAISEELESVIFSNARQKVVFGGMNIKDCEMFSKSIGELYVEVTSESVGVLSPLSMTKSSREELRSLVPASMIKNLSGFNTGEGEKVAEALCLLVIHNRIMPPQFAVISPISKSLLEPDEKIISGDHGLGNVKSQAKMNDSDEHGDLAYNYMVEKNTDDTKDDQSEIHAEIEESNPKRKRRGSRGRNKNNPPVDADDINESSEKGDPSDDELKLLLDEGNA
jgi:type IV secretory pathway TraG/TraD family ATPase VirD4